MALFTDGPLSSFEDLRAQDSQLGDVASVENIDVTIKQAVAHEQVGMELEQMLAGLQPVANVAETVPLRLWEAYRTLEVFYGDAYYSHLNDRYQAKRDQFHDLSDYAFLKLNHLGVGIVTTPVPRAQTPILTPTIDVMLPGTYYATMAWVNSVDEEGQAAASDAITISEGSFAVTPINPPDNAAGWNVFVGSGPVSMVLQNSSPMSVSESWFASGALILEGRAPGKGQAPNFL